MSELAGALADRELSVEELVDTAIARIGEQDDAIGAICTPDFDRARAQARKADEARADGDQRPLLGIPLLVSETFDVAGLKGPEPDHQGYFPARNAIAATDAVAVERARREGMIVLGKTRTASASNDPQARGRLFKGPANPWDLERMAGGPSGGAAAAVAAGFAPISLGYDETGALGIPAHFCGIFAHTPSRAVMPFVGVVPSFDLALSREKALDALGPMARSVADLTTMFGMLAGPDESRLGRRFQLRLPPARHYRLADFRVLVLEHHPCCPTSRGVRQVVRNVAGVVERRGATVHRDSPMLPGLAEAARLHMRLLHASLAASISSQVYEGARGWAATLEIEDRSLTAERLRGMVLDQKDWISADRERALLCARWEGLFEHYDVILCPAASATAFPRLKGEGSETFCEEFEHEGIGQLVWSGLAATAGLPSTVMPVDWDEDGLPIGVQIIGPAFEDYTALHFAALLEGELGGFVGPRHR